MNSRKHSLYLTLGIIIFTTVTIIISLQSTFNYIDTKNKIIKHMKDSSRTTILSLKDNIGNLITSYAVNEYDNLIYNEIKQKDIFAIVVEDYNMGKIMGRNSYISGKIKADNSNIINYDFTNPNQKKQLQECYYSDSFNITNSLGKDIGKISIYISSETMDKELTKIIRQSFFNTITISLLLIILLFTTIKYFILKPISDIIEIIRNRDKDGIPIDLLPNNGFTEISALSNTINKMIIAIKDSRLILKEKEAKLFQALELQTTIFDNSGYMMIRTDKDGIIKQINNEAEKLLGYSEKELIDIHTPLIFHLRSEVTQRAKEFSKELNIKIEPGFEVFVIKSNFGIYNEHEWTYISKKGKHIPVLLAVTALRDKNEEINGYLGIAQDISQRRFIESQARLASMGEMIGNIAHQWRQPLSVISSISSGIRVRSEFSNITIPEIIHDMDTITKQTKYLSKTIDDFRDFIKNTNKKEHISVVVTIEKALSILNSSLVNNHITLVLKLKDDLLIDGFENELIQAIINIVNNAKDAINGYTNKNKYIFIETKKTNNNLALIIKDNGGGIDKNIIDKIFEPYFTTKHQSVGTGIGLSMVHKILKEHHNASIKVSDETYTYEGNNYIGACFEITFRG